ncbi:MAG: hypothetical protein WBA74_16990, partial [Cyclobacteriaceae bacterium]
MEYKELYRLTVAHTYYENNRIDIRIFPDDTTRKLMDSLNVITRSRRSGFSVIAPLSDDGRFAKSLEKLTECRFIVYPSHKNFVLVTDLPDQEEILHFTNIGLPTDSGDLIKDTTTFTTMHEGFKAIAVVTIDLSEFASKDSMDNTEFKISFASKTVMWKYYFVHLSKDADFEIKTRNQYPNFSAMSVDKDARANSLLVKFPDSYIVAFQSDEAIPYR